MDSAATIGLIPDALAGSVRILGNAALAGAARLLLDTDAIARIRTICARATFVNLGGDPLFNELYVAALRSRAPTKPMQAKIAPNRSAAIFLSRLAGLSNALPVRPLCRRSAMVVNSPLRSG